MKTLAKNKGILATVAIFIGVMFINNLFFKQEDVPLSDELSAVAIGNDLVKIQTELQVVKLDRTLFSSTSYLLLNDFSIVVPAQPTGRANPFDIIGG